MPRQHLLAVWNPLYEVASMEAHLRVLQDRVRTFRGGRCEEDDVYVWWGKVRSGSRLTPIPHHRDVVGLDTELTRDDEGPETHIYLTDFSSLYVAHLGEVTEEDPRNNREHKGTVPGYYSDRRQRLECDFWFRLWDIRRLIDNDLPGVLHELRKLRNVRHHDRPVSIYGGMVDLPLIVSETEPKRYFDQAFRDQYIGGKFWVEHDSEQGGVGEIESELREHMFGEDVWREFGPTTRLFIATAEKLYRDHHTDMAFDFSPVIVEYCKAVEVRTNNLLWEGLGRLEPARRAINVGGRSEVFSQERPWPMARLAELIGGDRGRCDELVRRFENGKWFVDQFPPILRALAEFRGPAAHSSTVGRKEAMQWRNELCGIGCYGHFLNLAKVNPKAGQG
jgi:hypothetical protein